MNISPGQLFAFQTFISWKMQLASGLYLVRERASYPEFLLYSFLCWFPFLILESQPVLQRISSVEQVGGIPEPPHSTLGLLIVR